MTPEVQLALVNNLPQIITAIVSLVGAIGGILAYRKSNENHEVLKDTRAEIRDNTTKTEDVGKAVNGRMSSLIEEMKAQNSVILAEAVKAARLDVEKIALAHITDLKTQIAQAKSDQDISSAIEAVQTKLLGGPSAL